MVRQILPLAALLMGSGFLLLAGGINAIILPVRSEIEGFSAASLGLLGTGWAIGYAQDGGAGGPCPHLLRDVRIGCDHCPFVAAVHVALGLDPVARCLWLLFCRGSYGRF